MVMSLLINELYFFVCISSGTQRLTNTLQIPSELPISPALFRVVVGLCVALATVCMGIYAF